MSERIEDILEEIRERRERHRKGEAWDTEEYTSLEMTVALERIDELQASKETWRERAQSDHLENGQLKTRFVQQERLVDDFRLKWLGALERIDELERENERLRKHNEYLKRQLAHADPSWQEQGWADDKTEEWLIEWRERHSLAYIELAELCGLVRYRTSMPEEVVPEERSAERVERIFDSLKTLIEIDPDGRRGTSHKDHFRKLE